MNATERVLPTQQTHHQAAPPGQDQVAKDSNGLYDFHKYEAGPMLRPRALGEAPPPKRPRMDPPPSRMPGGPQADVDGCYTIPQSTMHPLMQPSQSFLSRPTLPNSNGIGPGSELSISSRPSPSLPLQSPSGASHGQGMPSRNASRLRGRGGFTSLGRGYQGAENGFTPQRFGPMFPVSLLAPKRAIDGVTNEII